MPQLLRGRPGVDVYDEGTLEGENAIGLDFAGAGVSVSHDASTRRSTVTVAAGGAPSGRHFVDAPGLHGLGALGSQQGSAPNQMPVWVLSPTANSGVGFTWQVPFDWAGGAVTVVIHYAHNQAVTGDVVHQLTTSLIEVGDRIDEAGSSTQLVESYPGDPAFTHHTQTWTDEFTPTAAGELWRFNYRRLGADAADTYVNSMELFGIELQYTSG